MSTRPSFRNWTALVLFAALFLASFAKAGDVSIDFNEANKLYEQGKYSEAAIGYQKLVNAGSVSAQIYFNLGNAFLKSGQMGRAIAAYRAAEKLSPRDPDVRSNLQFAREQVGGGISPSTSHWENWISRLTLNEWTVFASVGLSVLFLLLAVRQFRQSWRNSFRGLLLCIAVVCGFLCVCLIAAIKREFYMRSAVIIVSEAVVRPGPFDESPSAFTLRDGAEVTVLGRKDNWLEIADTSQRTGWLPGKNVMTIGNPKR